MGTAVTIERDGPCRLTRSSPINPRVRPAKTPPSNTNPADKPSFHQNADPVRDASVVEKSEEERFTPRRGQVVTTSISSERRERV